MNDGQVLWDGKCRDFRWVFNDTVSIGVMVLGHPGEPTWLVTGYFYENCRLTKRLDMGHEPLYVLKQLYVLKPNVHNVKE